MSFLDLPPIIERMLLVSDKISDLNFSVGQQPQVEINGKLTGVQPLGLQKLSPYQTEVIAMSLMEGNPDAVIGLDGLRQVKEVVAARGIPLVAIGGITVDTARSVLDAGADSVAVVSALLAAPEVIKQRTREFMRALDRPTRWGLLRD